MPDRSFAWELREFGHHLDAWKERDQPSQDLVFHVTRWVFTRGDDPFRGMQREAGFDNLWYGPVPGSYHKGAVVLCSYFILVQEHAVRCDSFATLNRPV